jgi:hypothetical protein
MLVLQVVCSSTLTSDNACIASHINATSRSWATLVALTCSKEEIGNIMQHVLEEEIVSSGENCAADVCYISCHLK